MLKTKLLRGRKTVDAFCCKASVLALILGATLTSPAMAEQRDYAGVTSQGYDIIIQVDTAQNPPFIWFYPTEFMLNCPKGENKNQGGSFFPVVKDKKDGSLALESVDYQHHLKGQLSFTDSGQTMLVGSFKITAAYFKNVTESTHKALACQTQSVTFQAERMAAP